MAGDWIKVEKSTARKPEILRIAGQLGIHPDHAFGLCVRFWCWCDDNLSDGDTDSNGNGNAPGVTLALLDCALGAQNFASALVSVGWLTAENDGVKVVKFDRHLSKSGKTRALASRRAVTHRVTKKKRSRNAASATPSSLIYSSLLVQELIPNELQNEEFSKVWDLWVAHRKEIKSELRKTMVVQQLKMLAKKGVSRAVAMIEYTIEKGWVGLREPETSNGRQQQPTGRVGPGQRFQG